MQPSLSPEPFNIYINTPDGLQILVYDVQLTDQLYDVALKIQECDGCDVDIGDMALIYQGERLEMASRVGDHRLHHQAAIRVVFLGEFYLWVRYNLRTLAISVTETDTVGVVKRRIHEHQGIPPILQHLTLRRGPNSAEDDESDRVLTDVLGVALRDYGITGPCHLRLVLKDANMVEQERAQRRRRATAWAHNADTECKGKRNRSDEPEEEQVQHVSATARRWGDDPFPDGPHSPGGSGSGVGAWIETQHVSEIWKST